MVDGLQIGSQRPTPERIDVQATHLVHGAIHALRFVVNDATLMVRILSAIRDDDASHSLHLLSIVERAIIAVNKNKVWVIDAQLLIALERRSCVSDAATPQEAHCHIFVNVVRLKVLERLLECLLILGLLLSRLPLHDILDVTIPNSR